MYRQKIYLQKVSFGKNIPNKVVFSGIVIENQIEMYTE